MRKTCFGHVAVIVSRVVLIACASVIATSGFAQTPGGQAVERAQLLRTQPGLRDDPTAEATETDETHAVATPNDPDLGEQAILKRAERYKAFSVSVGMPFSYTSNVALTRVDEQDDVLFTPSVALSYTPRLTRTLYANVSVAQQFFYYDEFDELDFGSFDVRAGLVYAIPKLRNLLLRADYSYNRLTSEDSFDEFFSSHALDLGVELPYRIGRAQQVSIGADVSILLDSDPEEPGRHDFSTFIGYSVSLTRALSVNAVGRLAAREYVEGERTDVSAILALAANYRFTKWLSLNAISTLATSNSDQNVFDYDVFNIGGALALNFRF